MQNQMFPYSMSPTQPNVSNVSIQFPSSVYPPSPSLYPPSPSPSLLSSSSSIPGQLSSNIFAFQQTIQPYENPKFLLQAFNSNQQSIAAFQTLTHEQKLQFYLSVQQMKMLGYMNDKHKYQSILQEIARRKMILKKPDANTIKNSQQYNDWGIKLDNLVDGHLKKIQKDNFLDDIPIIQPSNTRINNSTNQLDFLSGDLIPTSTSNMNMNINKQQNNQQDQFEWAQQSQQSKPVSSSIITNPLSSLQNGVNDQQQWETATPMQPSYANSVPIQSQSVQSSNMNGIFSNAHNMSNNTNSESHKEIQNKIDVWDLQVIQQQQPKALNKKQSQKTEVNQVHSSVRNISQTYSHNQSNIMFEHNVPMVNNIINNETTNSNKEVQYYDNTNTITNSSSNNNFNNNNSVTDNTLNFQFNTDYLITQIFSPSIVNENSEVQNKNDHFNTQNNIDHSVVVTPANNIQKYQQQQQHKQKQQQQFEQWQQPTISQPYQAQTVQPPSTPTNVSPQTVSISNQAQLFDYNFLQPAQPLSAHSHSHSQQSQGQFGYQSGSLYQTQQLPSPFINHSNNHNTNTNTNNNTNNIKQQYVVDTSFALDFTGLQNSVDFQVNQGMFSQLNNPSHSNTNSNTNSNSNSNNEWMINRQQQQQQQQQYQDNEGIWMHRSGIIPTIAVSNPQLLQPLKSPAPSPLIVSSLTRKLFDFNRDFYIQSLTLLQELGYSNSPDYSYLLQQSSICSQIFRLTQLYTAAVDQQQQQQLSNNLKQTKILYNRLDSRKCAYIVKKYIKMQGKGLKYQMARLCMQAGVPINVLQKCISYNKDNFYRFRQIITMLYVQVYLNNIYKIITNTKNILQYTHHILNSMESLAMNLGQMGNHSVDIVRHSQKFIQYRKDIYTILHIVHKIVQLQQQCTCQQLSSEQAQTKHKLTTMLMNNTSNNTSNSNSKSNNSNSSLIPNYYITFFASIASSSSSNNIYTLHAQMREFMDEHPICSLCFAAIDHTNQGSKITNNNNTNNNNNNNISVDNNDDEGKYYHYACWNLKETARNWKNKLIQTNKQQQQQAKQLEQQQQQHERQQKQHTDQQNTAAIQNQQLNMHVSQNNNNNNQINYDYNLNMDDINNVDHYKTAIQNNENDDQFENYV